MIPVPTEFRMLCRETYLKRGDGLVLWMEILHRKSGIHASMSRPLDMSVMRLKESLYEAAYKAFVEEVEDGERQVGTVPPPVADR